MDATLTTDLILNAAVLAAVTFVLSRLRRSRRLRRLPTSIAEGLLFGGGAWLAMAIPFALGDGLIVDGRSVMVSLAGAFGGPVTAAVAAAIAAAVRISIGGLGTFVGVLTILASAIIGLGFRQLLLARGSRWTIGWLAALGAATHVAVPALIATIPEVALTAAIDVGRAMLLAFIPGTIIGGILLDDGIRFAEQQSDLEAANLRLRDALESRSTFMAAVSHELRTPVTELYGFAEMLANDPDSLDADEHRDLLRRIAVSGMAVSDILRDISSVSHLESGDLAVDPGLIDVAAVVRETMDMHRDWTPTLELPDGRVECWADGGRVRQILRNLVTNAVRHGGQDYWVCVTQSDDAVEICVCDDGPGIPDEIIEKAFDPFVTTGTARSHPQAMGMGLWVSRELAERMGGTLTYDRSDGRSHFMLELPLAPAGIGTGSQSPQGD